MLDRNPRNALLASLRRRYNVSLVSFIDHQELVTNGFDALGIYFNASREEVTNLEKYGELMLEGSVKLGVALNSALTTKKLMEDAGFVDVVEVIYKWPLNRWPANKHMKEIGTFFLLAVLLSFKFESGWIVVRWSNLSQCPAREKLIC